MVKVGDVITLVSELLNINAYEAAKQINIIFHLGIDFGKQVSKSEFREYQCRSELIKQFALWENKTFQLLCDYYHLIQKWKKLKNPESQLYLYAIHEENYLDYVIDEIFINGTDDDKLWFWQNEKEYINKIKLVINNTKKGEYYEQ